MNEIIIARCKIENPDIIWVGVVWVIWVCISDNDVLDSARRISDLTCGIVREGVHTHSIIPVAVYNANISVWLGIDYNSNV